MRGCRAVVDLSSQQCDTPLLLADLDVEQACQRHTDLCRGLNTIPGVCVYPEVGEAWGLPYMAAKETLS